MGTYLVLPFFVEAIIGFYHTMTLNSTGEREEYVLCFLLGFISVSGTMKELLHPFVPLEISSNQNLLKSTEFYLERSPADHASKSP